MLQPVTSQLSQVATSWVSAQPMHSGTLDLLMTDVPGLVQFIVEAHIDNADHIPLVAIISMAAAVPKLCVSMKAFLKHKVNWNTVCGKIQDLHLRNSWLADNPVEVLNHHLPLLFGRYVPTKVIRLCNNDKSRYDDQCSCDFGLKQEAHIRWTRDRSQVN